jgi:hypothetical protein
MLIGAKLLGMLVPNLDAAAACGSRYSKFCFCQLGYRYARECWVNCDGSTSCGDCRPVSRSC